MPGARAAFELPIYVALSESRSKFAYLDSIQCIPEKQCKNSFIQKDRQPFAMSRRSENAAMHWQGLMPDAKSARYEFNSVRELLWVKTQNYGYDASLVCFIDLPASVAVSAVESRATF